MSAFRPTFVSHAHVDNDLCDGYVTALRARGIDTWYDRNDAQAGHFLGTDIQRELQQRTAFVLLMTQQALDSFWVQLELQAYLGLMAQDRSRILLPVRIGPCQVPPFLNALFWVDAQAMPFEQAIEAIAAALTTQSAPSAQSPVVAPSSPRDALPPLGPAPVPANSTPALHLTPMSLYNLGFRGYTIGEVECILPPICPVPSGIFVMGSDKSRDPKARDNEMPQYPVQVGDFALGQYPVTVAEYACAVRAQVVNEPQEWVGLEITWWTQLSYMDRPVVCVTWREARSYSGWLESTTGQPWRLPSEAEWEKAARGTDGRIYPWGDIFDASRVNIPGKGRQTLPPVGSNPSGASPYKVLDMAGPVAEWTSSIYRPYPYNPLDGREDLDAYDWYRVYRNTTLWAPSLEDARAAYRSEKDKDKHGGAVGFRLAWSGTAGS